MNTWSDIVAIISARRLDDSPLKRAMQEVRDRANGDIVIPLFDVEGEPSMQSAAPQLIVDAIDASSMRAASTLPTIHVPALKPELVNDAAGSRVWADRRRKAYYASWHNSAFGLVTRRAYRQLAGYGEMAMMVIPDFDKGVPRIVSRDALTTYPEPRAPEDIRAPENVGFIFGRSAAWLVRHYGEDKPDLMKMIEASSKSGSDSMWDVIEWIDREHIVMGVLGPRHPDSGPTMVAGTAQPMELSRIPNRAEMVTVAVGRQVTLDRVASAVSRVVGNADLMDRLLALDILAQERAIFPDRYLIAEDGRAPRILNQGGWQDGRTGSMNLLENVKAVGEIRSDTSPMTGQLIDRLERGIRTSSGNPALFGGELSGSLRSGQTVNALGSFSVDPRVQEFQEIMALHLTTLNEGIGATYKGYFSDRGKMTLFSGWPTDKGHVELEPAKHFESLENVVSYAFPGADVNGLTVAVGQLVGTRLMSRQTARTIHPMINDPAFELASVEEEAITDAVLQGFLSQAQNGSLPLADAARVIQLLRNGDTIDASILKAQREAQERQAQQAPPPDAGQATAPEAQPGLALPGQGVEQAPAPPGGPVPPPGQSVANFRALASALTAPVAGARR